MARDRAGVRGMLVGSDGLPTFAHQRGEAAFLAQEGGHELRGEPVARCAPAHRLERARDTPLRFPKMCKDEVHSWNRLPTTDLEDEGPGEGIEPFGWHPDVRPTERRGVQGLGNGGAEGSVAGELCRSAEASPGTVGAEPPDRQVGTLGLTAREAPLSHDTERVVLLSCFVPAH